jgi:O-antigen/teichoic acid export membrane protein
MLEKIKRLGTETAIYGVSTVLGRFLTFLLTPLYANVLPPADLGIVATVYAYIAVLNVIYHYGMDSAYMKYVSTLELAGRKETFTVPFLSVLITSVLLSSFIFYGRGELSHAMGFGTDAVSIAGYSALILFFDAVALIPFAALRMQRRAWLFSSIKLAGIISNVALAFLFLVKYNMGMEGVFVAGAISSALTALLLVPTVVGNMTPGWPRGVLKGLLTFGIPTLPAGLASIALQVIDRPILEALTDKTAVGIYQANYRLGIFMMLIVSMFEFAWRPFFFIHAQDPDGKPLFARVFTYLVLIMTMVFLLLSFFLADIVTAPVFFGYAILPAPYQSGLPIVPLVLLAYMFLGASTVFSAGLFIEKKTTRLPIVTLAGAGVNIVVNFALIPAMGIHGAALATLVSYAVMAVAMYSYGQKAYRVPYESARVGKIIAVAALVLVLHELLPQFWVVRMILICVFGMVLYWMKFFRASEINVLRKLVRLKEGIGHEVAETQGDPE